MAAGAGTPLLAPGGNGAPGLTDVFEWQRASDFVSLYASMQQAYNAGESMSAAVSPGVNDRLLLWQSGVGKTMKLSQLASTIGAGGSIDLGYQEAGSYLSAPSPDVTAAGSYSIGATSSDVRLAKVTTGVLGVQLGDGSAAARLMVADAPSASSPSIYGAGSTNNGLALVGGTVAVTQGGTYRAAFTARYNYGLCIAAGDAFLWAPGTDAYGGSGSADTQISRPAAGTVSFDTTGNADGLALLKFGGGRAMGLTSAAGAASTTEYPTAGDWGLHNNTFAGTVALAYNDGGTVKSVQLI